MHMQVTQKFKLYPAALIFELGWPKQAVPVEKTVKASLITVARGKVAGKNQYAVSDEDRMDPVCTSTSHLPSSLSRSIFNGTAKKKL